MIESKILRELEAILMILGGFILPGIGAIIGFVLLFIEVKFIADEAKYKINIFLISRLCKNDNIGYNLITDFIRDYDAYLMKNVGYS